MSRNRKPKHQPGDIYFSEDMGCLVRMTPGGEEEQFVPYPHEPFPEFAPDPLDHIPVRADGSVSPFYELDHEQLERLGQDTPATRRIRHDGWTTERQKDFIETLAATASVADACRYVGLSRQSAHKLYARSPQFRAAWDEALKAAVGVLAATAFDRAVNGTQEQVWHEGRMVGFREKHHDRLLIYLLRVRDPLNFAHLSDLAGWQRQRPIEQDRGGVGATLDRLEAAERAWQQAENEPRQLSTPADRLDEPPPPARPAPALEAPAPDPSTLSTSSTSRPRERMPRTPSTPSTSSTSPRARAVPRTPSTMSTSSTSPRAPRAPRSPEPPADKRRPPPRP